MNKNNMKASKGVKYFIVARTFYKIFEVAGSR